MKPTIIKLIPPELIGGKTYYADSDGNIRNAKGRIRKPHFTPAMRRNRPNMHSAYPIVRIGRKDYLIHILVCATFWGMRKSGQECHHLDGNKFNNRPTNLIFLDPDEHRRFDKAMRSGKIYVRSLVDPMVFEMNHHCEI